MGGVGMEFWVVRGLKIGQRVKLYGYGENTGRVKLCGLD